MANAKRNVTRRTTTTTTTTPTVESCVTIAAIIAFARTVTPATFAVVRNAIRAAFGDNGSLSAIVRRNVGRTTNRRIVDFQNWTYAENAEWQLDDVQLAIVWIAEFPAAVGRVFVGHPADVVAIIRNVRAQYNAGKHDNPVVPSVASVAYGDTARVKPGAMFPRAAAPAPAATPAPAPAVNVPAAAHAPAKTRGRLIRKTA